MNDTNTKDRIDTSINVNDYLKPSTPQDWDIILYNDDVTPFEGVFIILAEVFDLTMGDAIRIAMVAHQTGKAMVIGGLPDEETANEYIKECDALKSSIGCENLLITAEPSASSEE